MLAWAQGIIKMSKWQPSHDCRHRTKSEHRTTVAQYHLSCKQHVGSLNFNAQGDVRWKTTSHCVLVPPYSPSPSSYPRLYPPTLLPHFPPHPPFSHPFLTLLPSHTPFLTLPPHPPSSPSLLTLPPHTHEQQLAQHGHGVLVCSPPKPSQTCTPRRVCCHGVWWLLSSCTEGSWTRWRHPLHSGPRAA